MLQPRTQDIHPNPPPVRLDAYVVVKEPPPPPVTQAQEPGAPQTATTAPNANPPQPGASATTPSAPPPAFMPQEVGRDWTYYRDRDGSYFRIRRSGKTKAAIWGTGLGIVLATWAASLPFNGYAPIAGGFIAAANGLHDDTTNGLLIADGIVGIGGAIMVIVGISMSKEHIERQPVQVVPLAFSGGGGGGLSVRF
jgi:hypothetical protein